MLVGFPQQLSKLSNPSLSLPSTHPIPPCTSDCNLGFIFGSSLSFVKQISKLSSTCHYHIHDLCNIKHTLDFNTASTIATSLIHSHLDYCNSFYYFLPSFQLHHLKSIQNALGRAVSHTHLHAPITPTLQSLHWLTIEQCIQYKVMSIWCSTQLWTYLPSSSYTPRSRGSIRFADWLCLCPTPLTSRLKFSDSSFRNGPLHLWNNLPLSLRSYSSCNTTSSTTLSFPQLAFSCLRFLSHLKTHLFTLSYPP